MAYKDLVEKARLRQRMSKRALAAALAERSGTTLETARRAIYKYEAGTEPEPLRAAMLAVILDAPELALVQPPAMKRRGRQAELEARVAELEAALTEAVQRLDQVAARVGALEKQARPKQRPAAKRAAR